MMVKEFTKHFWSKVDKSGDCWEWKAYRMPAGYGQILFNGKVRLAHRVSWELTFGPIPVGLCVLHHCDNPPCVNPTHLWLGTYADNNKDMAQKDRVAFGETHYKSNLKREDVLAIREFAGSVRQGLLSKIFGVSQSQVSRIIHRKRWIRI